MECSEHEALWINVVCRIGDIYTSDGWNWEEHIEAIVGAQGPNYWSFGWACSIQNLLSIEALLLVIFIEYVHFFFPYNVDLMIEKHFRACTVISCLSMHIPVKCAIFWQKSGLILHCLNMSCRVICRKCMNCLHIQCRFVNVSMKRLNRLSQFIIHLFKLLFEHRNKAIGRRCWEQCSVVTSDVFIFNLGWRSVGLIWEVYYEGPNCV